MIKKFSPNIITRENIGCVFNYISNGVVEKMVDDLRSKFFPQIRGKYWNFHVFNYISNGLVEKMMDDLGSNFFPQISLL